MAHIDVVRSILDATSRRSGLPAPEAEDFVSWALLELMKDDCRVFRSHRGKSSMKTYLITVVQRLLLDYRIQIWGKWRPSAAAVKLGNEAIELERLHHREGYSLDEAISILRHNHGVAMSRSELEGLYEQLPHRIRRCHTDDGILESLPVDGRVGAGLEDEERRRSAARIETLLGQGLAELTPEDRQLLLRHYRDGDSITAIASSLGVRRRSLYTRRDRCLRILKRFLESAGLTRPEVGEILDRTDGDSRVGFGASGPEWPRAGASPA